MESRSQEPKFAGARTLQSGNRFVIGDGVRIKHVYTGTSRLPPRPIRRPSSGRTISSSNAGNNSGIMLKSQRPSSASVRQSLPTFAIDGDGSGTENISPRPASNTPLPHTAASVGWADEVGLVHEMSGARQRPVSARPRLQQAPVSFALAPPPANRQEDGFVCGE